MRLWSLHPRYLDRQGLLACWREALLAQAVLGGLTRGYRSHPQLDRFRAEAEPLVALGRYLDGLASEAERRGYRFDRGRIQHAGGDPALEVAAGQGRPAADDRRLEVTAGQIRFEWRHLGEKLQQRDPERWAGLRGVTEPLAHPLFVVVPGPVADWERPPVR